VEEPGFSDPTLLIDQYAMHYRDLPHRAAKAQGRDTRPDANRFAERNAMGRSIRVSVRDGVYVANLAHGFVPVRYPPLVRKY
jgi:hypothetical protein